RPVPRLASDRLDLDDAVLDLGDLELEQLLQQPGVRPAHDDLRALRPAADLGDVRLEPFAAAVRLRRDLLRLREEGLHLAEVEQRVAALGLLHDAGHDVALATCELLVGHLALRVAELLEDHLLRRLRADPAFEVVGDGDLLLGEHLHLDALTVLRLDLLEGLLEHAHLARLRVDLGPEPDEVVVGVGMLLLPRRLVRRGHRLFEALQDRLEADPLLPFELAERGDHLGVHRPAPLSWAVQSTTVRADAMTSNAIRRMAPSISRSMPESSAARRGP